jgi:hypothetical protein
MRAEAENNLILGIAQGIAQKTVTPKERPYFVTAVDRVEVVACALRTPPHKLVISRADAAAVSAIARDAFELYPELPGVNGPEPTVGVFARAWADLAGKAFRVGTRQRIYVIH